MNSLNEYTFIIKFWNEDTKIRSLFENCILKNTGQEFHFQDDPDIRFFELEIHLKDKFSIEKVIVYSEKNLKNEVENIKGYTDKENIFMTLQMDKYIISKNITTPEKGVLIKLTRPIKFSDSDYIMREVYPPLDIPFS